VIGILSVGIRKSAFPFQPAVVPQNVAEMSVCRPHVSRPSAADRCSTFGQEAGCGDKLFGFAGNLEADLRNSFYMRFWLESLPSPCHKRTICVMHLVNDEVGRSVCRTGLLTGGDGFLWLPVREGSRSMQLHFLCSQFSESCGKLCL